jgi:hypothetical protein
MTSPEDGSDPYLQTLSSAFSKNISAEVLQRVQKVAKRRAAERRAQQLRAGEVADPVRVMIVRGGLNPLAALSLISLRMSRNAWAVLLIHRLFKVGWRRAAAYTILFRVLTDQDPEYKLWTRES